MRPTEELLDEVAHRAWEIHPGQWLLCSSRWHETNLSERQMPTAQQIGWSAPNNRVYLPRGGHVLVTNSLGLEGTEISHDSGDSEGGSFVQDASGALTGMLADMPAFSKVTRLLPQTVEDDRHRTIRAGIKASNQAGISTIREPGLEAAAFRFYQTVVRQERFLRASLMWRLDLRATLEERKAWIDDLAPVSGFGDRWLDIWGLKVVLDGGVEGGYFHYPYCNDSNLWGFPLTSQENLEAILEQASGLDWRGPIGGRRRCHGDGLGRL